MNSRLPWIISRRRKLLGSTLDYITNFFLYNYIFFKEIGIYPSKLVSFSFAFFWIITSYVLGRYVRTEKISFNTFSKSLLKIILILLICNLIYLIINWGLPLVFYWDKIQFSSYISKEISNLFIRSSIYISFASLFIQYFFSIITYNIYDQTKNWFFYGKASEYRQVLNEIEDIKNDINLLLIDDTQDLDKLELRNIKGIVIGNFSDINKANLDVIFNLKLRGLKVESLLTWFENEFHRMPTEIIDNQYQLIEKFKSIEDSYHLRAKRIGDLLISFLLLIMTFPIIVVISILIFLEDQGPLLYSQTRTGLNGERIKIIKFRSMKIDAEKDGIKWSKQTDPRITRIGGIIRATRLDELPQLVSVINGTMSLIGPRPERPEIENKFLKDIPYYNYRYILKPGISGWAQVNFPYGASKSDSSKKLSYDIYYICHFSILLDLLILFKTIKLVLKAGGSKPNEKN